jgi:hypothetical protein
VLGQLLVCTTGILPHVCSCQSTAASSHSKSAKVVLIHTNACCYCINAYAQAEQVFELLDDMKKSGVAMSTNTYAAAIRACRRQKQVLYTLFT